MQNLSGSYYLLTLYPVFQTVTVLGLISIGAMFYIRDFCEGLAYNTSRCALWGGSAMLGVIYMGISILNNTLFIPAFLLSTTFHLLAGLISIVIAIANVRTLLAKNPRAMGTVMDTYHNLILLPGYTYLMLTLLPLIIFCGNGWHHILLLFAIIIYVGTLKRDMRTGRLNQPQYLLWRGLILPLRD